MVKKLKMITGGINRPFAKMFVGPARLFSTKSSHFNAKTFKSVITEEVAARSPQLVTLHSRLQLPSSYKLSTLARCLTCIKADRKYPSNYGLSVFGKNLLTYYASEHFLMKYPRLPLSVHNNAVDSVLGDEALYVIGKNWGIEFEETTELQKYLEDVPEEHVVGKLRFDPAEESIETNFSKVHAASNYKLTRQVAMASAVKSIIGGFYASTKSSTETKNFINNYLLRPRKVDMQALFEFLQPTRELAVLCRRQNLESPVSRLLSETGRVSKRPVFIVGVFSGTEKLFGIVTAIPFFVFG